MPAKETPNTILRSFSSFAEVEETWKAFLPENHHLACCDIAALEASRPPDIDFYYVNVMENDELIGIMYIQCLHFNKHHFQHEVLNKPVLKWFRNIILRYKTRILVCGNLFRVNFQGFYFKDKARREMVFDCLKGFRSTLKHHDRYSGILVKDCSRIFQETQFGCHSFQAFNQDLTMELHIRDDWRSMKDYCESLSRKYRQRASKIMASRKSLQLHNLSLEEIKANKQKLEELYNNIVKGQSLTLGLLNADYFIEMKTVLGEKFKVFGYFHGSEMLAFSSHIYYPVKNCMEIHYIGLDYQFNNQYNLYFNILFDGIETAITEGYKKIEMGRTAREAKASAGAHSVENFNYVWIKPGLTRFTVRMLGNWFENSVGEEWKKRNPFKSVEQSAAVQV